MSKELFEKKIYVGSFMPGTVDTAMQSDIRTTDSEENPLRDMFVSLHANMAKTDPSETAESKGKPPPTDALDSPENVAHFVSFLLSGMEPEEFVSADHDIRNSQLFSRWH
ncbi:hypothetical protein SARC_01306 [Sphaeroforma arctica JP610]|uniref:Uncharacterized protein n=1 Tax=Sphaeroforma arctica JP610 TaxID=667725 RepID=A0A0L0GE48_9EUKA|nr:hypothetical protein SARC_01306 [Sphaeroforma arctica JP610]KNC86533.1 hypothetical protein SARC_01306 [Sphaeroforma arctica JP610]|eukprot:XP_014160435.1 hypothetical protein SARC_01306 [Sphaeroforma arctica JP610]